MLRQWLLVLFLSVWSVFAQANGANARAALAGATDRMRQLQRSTPNCPPGRSCNHLQFLQALEARDHESTGLWGVLASRAPACSVAVDKTRFPQNVNRFANAADLAKHFSERFPEIGVVNRQRIADCGGSNDTSSRYKVAKFYMYMKRFNEGAARAYEELAAIDQLLGEKETLKCEGRGTINQAFQRCQELNQLCRRGVSQLRQVAADAAAKEGEYLTTKAEIQNLQSCVRPAKDYAKYAPHLSASNPKIEHCEQVFVERQAPQRFCSAFTLEGLQKIQQCQKAIGHLQTNLMAIESMNPWFRSENYFEMRKTKTVEESIRSQALINRRELKKKIIEFRNAGLCVNGFLTSTSSECQSNKIRAVLAAAPEIPLGFDRDPRRNVGNLYLEAQSCIEEGVRDQTEATRVINGAARDAGLTLLTMGASNVVMGAKALWTVRGVGMAAVAFGGVAANLTFMKESYEAARRACGPEEQQLSIATQATHQRECPGPKSQMSQANKVMANCLMARTFAAMDTLPFVPFSQAMRATTRLVRASRAIPEVREVVEATSGVARQGDEVAAISRRSARDAAPSGGRAVPSATGVPRDAASSAPLVGRRAVVRDYAQRMPTTEAQNSEWMRLGSKVESDGRTTFLDVQNSSIKRLNDATDDKVLVSALTNKNLEIVSQRVSGVLKKFPGVEAIPYSDFKGIRYAFRSKPPATSLPKGFDEELRAALEAGNQEFAAFVRQAKVVGNSEDPARWFSYGYGQTGDQANMAARYGREQTGQNLLQNFSDPGVHSAMNASLQGTERLRSGLAGELGGTKLWDSEAGRSSLRTDVFELSRKATSAEDLQAQIQRTTGVAVTRDQARRILDYSRSVDEFSPGISVAQRQDASLTSAAHGGISIDFKGIGGQNLKETAEALAGAKSLPDAVVRARLGESPVTEALRRREAEVRAAIREVANKNNIAIDIRMSGDDMVVIPNREMTGAERQQIAQAIANTTNPSSIRMSSVPAGIPASRRSELAAAGESIEKQLRQNLQGQIPKEKLERILFSVEMQSKGADQVATLRTISRNDIRLSEADNRIIDEAFARAVVRRSPHASPADMQRNAALSPAEKLEAFEDVNNLPRGYVSTRSGMVDEIARIETAHPTPVSSTPAARRPRAEREALVAKRNDLRRAGFTDSQIRRGMDQGIFGSNLPKQNQALASAKVKHRYEGEAADGAGFGGGQSDGVEILESSSGDIFAKILPYRVTDELVGDTRSSRFKKIFETEVEYGQILSDQGLGPKFIGTFVGGDGRPRIAYEFVDGVDVRSGDGIMRGMETLPDSVTGQMRDIAQRLVKQGIYPGDLQFRVGKNGKVYVIDSANFSRLSPSQIPGALREVNEEIDEIGELIRQAKADVRAGHSAAEGTSSKIASQPVLDFMARQTPEAKANMMGRPDLANEIARIEAKYPTPVSNLPANQRPFAEQRNLAAKRQALRKAGMTDAEIKKYMDRGLLGSPSTGAASVDRVLADYRRYSADVASAKGPEGIANANRLAAQSAENLNRVKPGSVADSAIATHWRRAADAQMQALATDLKVNYKSETYRSFFVRNADYIYGKEVKAGFNATDFRNRVGPIRAVQTKFDMAFDYLMRSGRENEAREMILKSPLLQNNGDPNRYFDQFYLPHYRRTGTATGVSGLSN